MGHVGYALTRLAAEAGLDVIGQYRSAFREADARALGNRVEWVRGDLSDPSALAALARRPDIDRCIHTAAMPNDRVAGPDPAGAFKANVQATAGLLEAARIRSWQRFIYVSTGSVFQTETDFTRPILEDHPPRTRSPYGSTKLCGEILTSMYRHYYQLPAATVRISFVYGPPLAPIVPDLPRGPIPVLLREAMTGPVRHPSGGDFEASFTYVEDAAAGLLAACQANELRHDIYHLGHGRNWNTYAVAEAVRAAVPDAIVEVGPGTLPWTQYNTMRGPLAGSRLAEDTGFKPAYSLAAGVRAFAAWMNAERLAGETDTAQEQGS